MVTPVVEVEVEGLITALFKESSSFLEEITAYV